MPSKHYFMSLKNPHIYQGDRFAYFFHLHVTIAYDSYIDSGNKSLAFLKQQEEKFNNHTKKNIMTHISMTAYEEYTTFSTSPIAPQSTGQGINTTNKCILDNRHALVREVCKPTTMVDLQILQ